MKSPDNRYSAEKILYRVHILSDIGTTRFGYIQARDIVKATHTYDKSEANSFTITFKNRELWYQLKDIYETSEVLIEYLIGDISFVHFMTNHTVKKGYNEGEYQEEYTITAMDWDGYKEDKTIIEHNVEYVLSDLPVDSETGEVSYPYDFNKIAYPNTDIYGNDARTFQEILTDIYAKNMGMTEDDVLYNVPYARIKGSPHLNYGRDITRTPVGCSGVTVEGNIDSETYYINYEKKSVFEFKKDYYNWLRGKGVNDVYRTRVEVSEGNKYHVYVSPSQTITINAITDKDVPNGWSYEFNNEDYVNDVLIEASDDNFYETHRRYHEDRDGFSLEAIDSAAGDQEDSTEMLTKVQAVYGENLYTETVKIDITFKEHQYLLDFREGDFIQLTNMREDFLNGIYQINKIDEVIENGSIDYAIEEMIKI